MQIVFVEDLESLLFTGVANNRDTLNDIGKTDVTQKWQQANDLYYSLEGVDNPLARALIALRATGYLYESSAMLEGLLNKMVGSFSDRKKIYGARLYAAEKKESVLAAVANETEKTCLELMEVGFDDTKGKLAVKISYLKELKKLSESSVSLKDIKIENSNDAEEGQKRKNEMLAMIDQYQKLKQIGAI